MLLLPLMGYYWDTDTTGILPLMGYYWDTDTTGILLCLASGGQDLAWRGPRPSGGGLSWWWLVLACVCQSAVGKNCSRMCKHISSACKRSALPHPCLAWQERYVRLQLDGTKNSSKSGLSWQAHAVGHCTKNRLPGAAAKQTGPTSYLGSRACWVEPPHMKQYRPVERVIAASVMQYQALNRLRNAGRRLLHYCCRLVVTVLHLVYYWCHSWVVHAACYTSADQHARVPSDHNLSYHKPHHALCPLQQPLRSSAARPCALHVCPACA